MNMFANTCKYTVLSTIFYKLNYTNIQKNITGITITNIKEALYEFRTENL